MINILKLRKLEKENKQRKSPESDPETVDTVEINETIPAPEEKKTEGKASPKTRKIKSSKKKPEASVPESSLETVSQIDDSDKNEDNPVEIFRQNLLNELLNSDSLPEFSDKQSIPEIPSDIGFSETTESSIEEIVNETSEKTFQDISGSTVASPDKIPDNNSNAENKSELETVNSAIEKGKKNHDALIHMVSFSLGRESYGVDIMRIREIIRMVDITKVPRAPEFIEGVINLRGSVIPVINLRTRIKLPWKEYDKSTRIIVMELKQAVIGFIVDEVKEVLRISDSVIAPPPLITVGKKVEYITGVAKLENCLIILIEPERLLSNNELDKLKS